MAATPILAQGTTITVDDGAGTPITINGVISINGIGSGTASEIDVTTLASSAKEYRQGLQDYGSMTLELIRNEDDLGQAELLEIKAAQETRTFIVTLPTSTLNVMTFSGFVTQLNTDIGADDVARGNAIIKITGAVTLS